MGSYAVFVALTVLTIALPGPGVLMTINNAARRGFHRATAGIFGISLGVLMVAALSATGLGVLLAKSATAFMVMKYIGALYLIYLGVKVWRAKDVPHSDSLASEASAFTTSMERKNTAYFKTLGGRWPAGSVQGRIPSVSLNGRYSFQVSR